ncbi:FAD/NAD(P)-binding domain-containing protein [Aspergillus ibericus CBS 121593]|uniref:FAD/NAD(P)-binding domain-containing protein n=1 Tax=Aspergillus ibericus CBS 121593 TaxID=1448316 RepID=A0A395H7U6_9EURO|nr:FAD/NAD(P)-binding domain-containing protein [Aspergillus ibericus CBS 121593]RAL03706.1 FAD/NAD(P)-binding domain-containing protein [Aspergillus ibericus CBS 121593]
MSPRYRRIAVIGTGPSGLSAVKALHDENTFDTIRVFERRDRVGGIWHYDPTPDPLRPEAPSPAPNAIPTGLPQFTPPRPEDPSARTGIYPHLDSNVGAKTMAFTHTPFPPINSATSIKQFGPSNATRPFRVVANYLEDLFIPYLHLVSLNTTVERAEKTGSQWTLTLRKSNQLYRNTPQDYWWTETFDAIIVASGHYNEPAIPAIPGLSTTALTHPHAFEHAKAFRHPDHYINQRVLVVGGNISAADLVTELHSLVSGPLYLSQRGSNPALEPAWSLPNVQRKPTISHITPSPDPTRNTITVHFTDTTTLTLDKILFATGYTASYPFLTPNPVTANNRVAGFYQHIFRITDPSLALVGQVRAGLSFRVYEYQAVAVARYYAGRTKELPSQAEQDRWEFERLKSKGNGVAFHEIKPDFREYFEVLLEIAGTGAGLPAYEDRWAEEAFEVLKAKEGYWKRLRGDAEGKGGEQKKEERAKL